MKVFFRLLTLRHLNLLYSPPLPKKYIVRNRFTWPTPQKIIQNSLILPPPPQKSLYLRGGFIYPYFIIFFSVLN